MDVPSSIARPPRLDGRTLAPGPSRPPLRRLAACLGLLSLFALSVLPGPLHAQAYVDEGRTRHSFAQFVLGADLMAFPAGGETFAVAAPGSGPAQLLRAEPRASLFPRLNLAGTHFWGHASFYVSVPLGNLRDAPLPGGGEIDFNPGVETGLRIYPWRLESGGVRPFVGAAYAQSDLRQTTDLGTGVNEQKSRIPLQAGLTYQRGSTLWELGFGRFLNNDLDYHVDRTATAPVRLPSSYLWFGVNRQLDTTLGLSSDWEDGTTAEATRRAARAGALSGWSVGVGPSAAFLLGSAPRNQALYPALGAHRTVSLFPDVGVGYYHFPWDTHLNLAYRSNASERSAYGQTQRLGRRSLGLEVFRFLFDYEGFAPFVGPVLSREWLELEESVDGAAVGRTGDERWRLGVIFGWDIRPDDLRGVILRTNLRYTPVGRVGGLGGVSADQLEFNFIQVVWYPGRTGRIRRALGGG